MICSYFKELTEGSGQNIHNVWRNLASPSGILKLKPYLSQPNTLPWQTIFNLLVAFSLAGLLNTPVQLLVELHEYQTLRRYSQCFHQAAHHQWTSILTGGQVIVQIPTNYLEITFLWIQCPFVGVHRIWQRRPFFFLFFCLFPWG